MKNSVNKLVEKVSESCEERCQFNNHPTPDHYPAGGDHDDVDNVDVDHDDVDHDDVDSFDDDDEASRKYCICIFECQRLSRDFLKKCSRGHSFQRF